MEMTLQSSYPLNSENARPPGTFTVYLSCAEMALPPRTASATEIIAIVTMLLAFTVSNSFYPSLASFLLLCRLNPNRSAQGWRYLRSCDSVGRRVQLNAIGHQAHY